VLAAALELLAAPVSTFRPLPRAVPSVYAWLGQAAGAFAIVELPMPADESSESEEDARYQLYSLIHQKRIANGVAASVPPLTRELRTEMQEFPGNASVAMLRNLGVNYVLVHTERYPREHLPVMREQIERHNGLRFVDHEGPVWVLDVVPITASRTEVQSRPPARAPQG
jgi:hypothetical protein